MFLEGNRLSCTEFLSWLILPVLLGMGNTENHSEWQWNRWQSHFLYRTAILREHNVYFLERGGTAVQTPPIYHSTHQRLGCNNTSHYFNKPLNPSAHGWIKETDAEKSEGDNVFFRGMKGRASPLFMGPFWGHFAIVRFAAYLVSDLKSVFSTSEGSPGSIRGSFPP